jgi:capsular exopolysaccharide synthesis family protein
MIRDEIRLESEAADRISKEIGPMEVDLRSPLRILPSQDAGIQKKDIKRWLMAQIGAPLAAFLFACVGVAFMEFRGRRIQSTDEVAGGLGLRVIGSVPALTKAAQRPDDEEVYEHELLESIDGIRTLLLRDARMESTRAVMVTSAVSGEGKTTLASHLASSLARAGRRTLLVDCDLRRPAAHQLFELPLQPGFSEVLMNEVHVAEAVRSTAVENLWVMPAGQWDREVMQALARDGGADIFERLKSEYDFIIVDSHPVLPATDSLLIGQHVDAVLMSLLRDVSQTPRVHAAGQRLASLGIRVLGAVVNGMKPEDYGNGYVYTAQPANAA